LSDADDGCSSGSGSSAGFDAVAGTTYHFAVDGAEQGGRGVFDLRVRAGPPLNDRFADAADLGEDYEGSARGTSVGATIEDQEPNHAGSRNGISSWYRWTAPASGSVSFDTCDSSFDTTLAVYSGTGLADLTPVAGNDDDCGFASRLSADVVRGREYRIAVAGYRGSWGQFTLSYGYEKPANDEFAYATDLGSGRSAHGSGLNRSAGKEDGEPAHASAPGGASVWFRWRPAETGWVIAAACDSTFDTVLGIYRGRAVTALEPVAANDDGCGPQSVATFKATGGVTYWFAVDGSRPGELGAVDLALSQVADPPPDPVEPAPPKFTDVIPPDTAIMKGPRRTRSAVAEFRFMGSEGRLRFSCSIDNGSFTSCPSVARFRVPRGRHILRVRAVDRNGNIDPSPAQRAWIRLGWIDRR
jgi:hypothetical protein